MPKTGRIAISGTALSGTCVFTEEGSGGKIRGCPLFLGMLAGKGSIRLSDTSSGRWTSIEINKVDRRGNATFRWI